MKKSILIHLIFIVTAFLIIITSKNVYASVAEDVYSVDSSNKIIYDILPKTTIASFKANMKLSSDANIYKNNQSLSNDSFIASGMILDLGNTEKYTLIVKGDVNGDGTLSPTDLLNIKQLIVGILDEKNYNLYCTDIDENNKLTSTDLIVIKSFFVNIPNATIIKAKGIVLEENKIVINMRDGNSTATIAAKVTPITAKQDLQWASADTSVAEVDQNGTVTAKQKGMVTIIAKNSNNISITCDVEVKTSIPISNRIYVGDSRTVSMKAHVKSAIGENPLDIWSCKDGAGRKWMKETGVPEIENKIVNGSAVIILLGCNDVWAIERAEDYYTYINDKAKVWEQKGAMSFFVSVNPIGPRASSSFCSNPEIKEFNQAMKNHLADNVIYIDTFNGFVWPSSYFDEKDGNGGVHYTKAGSIAIYNFVNDFIAEYTGNK